MVRLSDSLKKPFTWSTYYIPYVSNITGGINGKTSLSDSLEKPFTWSTYYIPCVSHITGGINGKTV